MTVRKRPVVQLTLSDAALARLDEMATRLNDNRSRTAERIIFEAEMPKPSARTKKGKS